MKVIDKVKHVVIAVTVVVSHSHIVAVVVHVTDYVEDVVAIVNHIFRGRP